MTVIAILLATGISFEDYAPAKRIMTFLLGPATVALALPLYKNRQVFFRNFFPALCGLLAGSLGTMIAAGLTARTFGFTPELVTSISMIGAAFGPWLMNRFRIAHPVSRGLALGTISHGLRDSRGGDRKRIHRSGRWGGDGIGRDLHLSGSTLPCPSPGWVNRRGSGHAWDQADAGTKSTASADSLSDMRWVSSDPLLLLGPRIGQGLGEAGDREVRRRGAIDDRRNDAGRQEGEGSEQADVPFALGLTLGDLGEGGNAAEPDIVIRPIPGALAMAVRRASGSRVSSLALRPGHE